MKKGKARLLLMAAALIGLTGCGKEGAQEQAGAETAAGDDYVYVAEYQSLSDEGYYITNAVFGKEDTLFFAGTKEDDNALFSLKIGEGADTAIANTKNMPEKIPVELEDDEGMSGLGKDMEGNLLVGIIRYGSEVQDDGSMQIQKVEIRKLSPDGKVLENIDTGNAFLKVPNFYIQNILSDKDGNYYVCGSQSIYVVKADGTLYCEMPVDGIYISNMFAMKDGSIVVGYYTDTGWAVEQLDLQTKGLKPLESKISFGDGTYRSGRDTDLLYTQGTMLYTCNLKDEEPEEILNWVDSDINSDNLKDFVMLEDGRIAAVSIDWMSAEGTAELAVLTRKLRSEVPEKKVLTYGSIYMPYFANEDIVAFNKQSQEYRIEIKEYGDDSTDYETKVSLFNADLSGAEGPDIIDMMYCPVGLEELVNAGSLEDLNPYFEKDGEIKKEDYVENAMKAYEVDGGLYGVMSNFGIMTLTGKVSDVGEGTSWTVEEMMALADSLEEGTELIPYSTKNGVLQMLCTVNDDMFVDEETGKCNFEDEEFLKILEFANRFPEEVNYDPDGPSDIDKIRNGQLLLLNYSVSSVQQYQQYEGMFGEPINFIGYPTSGESGSMLTPNGTTVAMSAKSENKEGVWEFMSFLLSKERQENLRSANAGFPLRKEALEKQFAKDMEAEYYEDADGNKKEKSKATWSMGDFSIEVFAAKKEQVDRIRQMIDTARSNSQMDSDMFNIIQEEAQSYFKGQKSPEEAAALIQNRVQTYINETR